MKLSLEEARKRANELRGLAKRPQPKISNRRIWNLMKADYAYAEHCRAVVPELVAALEDLAFDAARVERKFSEGRDWTEWRDLRDKLGAVKDLLARAKTVEMP